MYLAFYALVILLVVGVIVLALKSGNDDSERKK